MQGTIELTTERCILRRYRTEDAADLYRSFGADLEMYRWSGWNPYATPEMAAGTVKEFIRSYENPGAYEKNALSGETAPFYGWAVELKQPIDVVETELNDTCDHETQNEAQKGTAEVQSKPSSGLIGTIGAYDYDAQTDTIEVGLSICRSHWGKGFATEALRAVLEYLTEEEGIGSVTAWCAADNIGSKRAMKKAGMQLQTVEPKALHIGENHYDKLTYLYTIPNDLTFRMKNGTFNYRVGAIIIHDGKLLLMKNEEEPYYYSVGGRVRFNETTEEAVLREVKEEIGTELEIDRFLFFQEQFFDGKVTGTHIHELGVYYLMKDSPVLDHITSRSGICRSVTARGVAEELVWIPLKDCDQYYIVPESVAAHLQNLPDHPEHLIEIDER